MPVYLGVDLGEKRVGLARSDEQGMIAEAWATLEYRSEASLVRQIKQYVDEIAPGKIVVGLPKTLRGEMGKSAQNVVRMTEKLKAEIPGEWVFWDESFSTREAEEILLEADLSRRKRKGIRDRLAAQRILQSYLDGIRK